MDFVFKAVFKLAQRGSMGTISVGSGGVITGSLIIGDRIKAKADEREKQMKELKERYNVLAKQVEDLKFQNEQLRNERLIDRIERLMHDQLTEKLIEKLGWKRATSEINAFSDP